MCQVNPRTNTDGRKQTKIKTLNGDTGSRPDNLLEFQFLTAKLPRHPMSGMPARPRTTCRSFLAIKLTHYIFLYY
jgi:hypothetical protein